MKKEDYIKTLKISPIITLKNGQIIDISETLYILYMERAKLNSPNVVSTDKRENNDKKRV